MIPAGEDIETFGIDESIAWILVVEKEVGPLSDRELFWVVEARKGSVPNALPAANLQSRVVSWVGYNDHST